MIDTCSVGKRKNCKSKSKVMFNNSLSSQSTECHEGTSFQNLIGINKIAATQELDDAPFFVSLERPTYFHTQHVKKLQDMICIFRIPIRTASLLEMLQNFTQLLLRSNNYGGFRWLSNETWVRCFFCAGNHESFAAKKKSKQTCLEPETANHLEAGWLSIGWWFQIFRWEMVGNHQTSWLFRLPGVYKSHPIKSWLVNDSI